MERIDTEVSDEDLVAVSQVAYRVAFRLLGNRSDAEDVTQESVAKAIVRWKRIHTYADAWVARTAANGALDVLRKRRRSVPNATTHEPDPLIEERMDLARLLRRLPRRQREVVVLRYLADLSERDVAERLGCGVGTVKTHAARGLAALRVQLVSAPKEL